MIGSMLCLPVFPRELSRARQRFARCKSLMTLARFFFIVSAPAVAQNPAPSTETPKKANARPAETTKPKTEPFDGASVEKMTGQCVALDTEQGVIMIEVLPQKAPESARN